MKLRDDGRRLRMPAMLLVSGTLLASCASTSGSVTTETVCDELRASLPTWSARDTEQSRIEGAEFVSVFAAVCP